VARSAQIASFAAEYDLTLRLEGIGLHSRGRLYYSGKSCYRVEGITNGHRIITVSRGEVSQTYFVDLKVVSRSNRIENQTPVDLLHGLSDIRDSFSSTDEETLNYVEEALVDDRKTYHFQGRFRTVSMLGVAKVRMPIEVDLFVDQETCLLLRRVWTQTGKGTLVNAHYKVMEVNLPLDDTLFSIDPSLPDIKQI
jgi:outer membrane lipoprotein-sorting protein